MSTFGPKPWKSLGALCVSVSLLFGALPAWAFDESMRPLVRQLSQEGVNAYLAKDYRKAADKLERAWAMLPTAPIGLWSARALEKSGHLVAASERYLAATRAPLDKGGDRGTQEKAQNDAAEEHQKLLPRIPTLRIDIQGAEPKDVELVVAGRTLPSDFVGVLLPVDPGQVDVVARVGDFSEEATVSLAEGETKQVTLDFGDRLPDAAAAKPAKAATAEAASATIAADGSAASRSSWQKPAGWLGIGIGGAGLILGGVSGGVLMDKYGALGCGANMDCVTTEDDAAQLNTWRMVSTASLIAGGVLAAAGVTLLVTAPRSRSGATVAAYLTGAELGVAGRF